MDGLDLGAIRAMGKGSVMVDGLRLTLRSEERRGQEYWYAYRHVGGKTKKVYLGADLTSKQLARAAMLLSEASATTAPPATQLVLGNALTQQNGDDGQELAALRGELAAIKSERNRLARRLDLIGSILHRYDSQKVIAANGKASPRWDKAVKLLDDLIPLCSSDLGGQ